MKTEPRTDYSMTAGEALPIAVRAEGCWIEDSDGRRYLDACGGAMVMLLGHNHPRVIEALNAQSRELSFIYRFSFRNEPMLELAERIAEIAPGELEWCFFNSSGSEANESAMHLSVLYWELLGKPGKTEFLSRATSYHGSTLGALSLSGSRWRAPFEPLLHKYAAVPNSTTAEEGAAELEAAIMSRGADHVAAFMIEPVTGSSGAAVDLPDGYLAARARGVRPPRRAPGRRRDRQRLRPHRAVVRGSSTTARRRTSSRSARAIGARRAAAVGDDREPPDPRGGGDIADRLLVRAHVLRLPARLRRRDAP